MQQRGYDVNYVNDLIGVATLAHESLDELCILLRQLRLDLVLKHLPLQVLNQFAWC